MYVHVGDNVMIRSSEIIAILDKLTVVESEIMKELFDRRKNDIVNLANGSFKSIVLTPFHIYLSPIALATLKKKTLNGIAMSSMFTRVEIDH